MIDFHDLYEQVLWEKASGGTDHFATMPRTRLSAVTLAASDLLRPLVGAAGVGEFRVVKATLAFEKSSVCTQEMLIDVAAGTWPPLHRHSSRLAW